MRIFLVVALVAGAFADDSSPVEETKYAYHGLYADKCDLDGLYYKDFNSFVMCNSGVGVVQACSPGTKNDEERKFVYGGYYGLADFCAINLLVADYNPVANAYHAPIPSFHAPLNTYHAPIPSYHAPLPVHKAPVAAEEPEKTEEVEAEAEKVEAGFSRSGLFQGYGQQDGKFVFRGKYADECKLDGLYYRDYQSYVICSNNNAYVQPCAPGTRNSVYDKYAFGGYYSYADFCDVNLTDFGYAAKRSAYGYAQRAKFPYGYNRAYGYGRKAFGVRGLGYPSGLGYGYQY